MSLHLHRPHPVLAVRACLFNARFFASMTRRTNWHA